MSKRKIILNLCTSLDGYIEGPTGEYDWCFTDQDYGMTHFLANIDTIFFGRKSYELFKKEDTSFFEDKKFVVFSKSFQDKNIYVISENIEKEIIKMQNLPGKNIWLFGGANLFNSLLKLKLVDELIISIHPLILGNGKKLFNEFDHRTKLKLIESKDYNTGLVQVRYKVERLKRHKN